jgi:hypothetical protein
MSRYRAPKRHRDGQSLPAISLLLPLNELGQHYLNARTLFHFTDAPRWACILDTRALQRRPKNDVERSLLILYNPLSNG